VSADSCDSSHSRLYMILPSIYNAPVVQNVAWASFFDLLTHTAGGFPQYLLFLSSRHRLPTSRRRCAPRLLPCPTSQETVFRTCRDVNSVAL
jgi:hypothetical protein